MNSPWVPFNGHITWIGPQEKFWARQTANPVRQSADWPPDPYVIYGRFSVAQRTANRLVLEGPDSPVSGLRLKKEYTIQEDGSVVVRVAARNIRSEPVSFNLWSNTRVDGSRICCVPMNDTSVNVGTYFWMPYDKRQLPWNIQKGWFYFEAHTPEQLPAQIAAEQNKAKLFPSCGVIVAIGESDAFVKQFHLAGKGELYPGQGAVELYQRVSRTPEEHVAELEFYGPYQTVAPGESVFLEEVWRIVPYRGGPKAEDKAQWAQESLRPSLHPDGLHPVP